MADSSCQGKSDSTYRLINNTVHEILVAKCQSRDIEPTRDMIDDQELYERSRERYAEMRLDRGDSPLDFEADYRSVADFYHSMPWS